MLLNSQEQIGDRVQDLDLWRALLLATSQRFGRMRRASYYLRRLRRSSKAKFKGPNKAADSHLP